MSRGDPLGHSSVHHFAQANPAGPDAQGDVPALLRRIADTLEKIDGADVLDLVLHDDINEHGSWYNIVVYYTLPADPG